MDATAVLHSSKQGAKHHDIKTGAVGDTALPRPAVISKTAPRSLKSAASTSAFKGVTKHKSTGKFEAHLWDSTHIRLVKVSMRMVSCQLKLDCLLITSCPHCLTFYMFPTLFSDPLHLGTAEEGRQNTW